ncbi:MAG: hypothetical protein LBR08_12760 [Bacteroidales bacterium]|jgi:hypothetical protein|nr:hypothetical protein [Bacteroidales bacterium]
MWSIKNTGILFVFVFWAASSNISGAPYGMPKVGVAFDFNPSTVENGIYGFRVHATDNRKLQGSRNRNYSQSDRILPYTYGIGFGGYRMNGKQEVGSNSKYLYQFHLIFTFNYLNRSNFDPFIGACPGYATGAKNGFFFNPVAGMNVRLFDVNRNWNSNFVRAFFQVRVEYNTILSSVFTGGGFVLQFF